MLRTRVKASSITNLTDARYFAAWGVDWMGFCLDPAAETYLSPRQLEAIRAWVDGPRYVGEFNLQTSDEIGQAIEMLKLDAIQAGPFTPAEVLQELDSPVPVIKEFALDRDTEAGALREAFETFAPLAGTFLIDAQRSGLSWSDLQAGRPFSLDLLSALCETYPTLLALDIEPAQLEAFLAALNPLGLSLRGGAEERVGFKSFDELDDLFEALEDVG